MDDLVRFDNDNVGAGSQIWQRFLWWFNDRRKGVFVCVDRRKRAEVSSFPLRLAVTLTLLCTMHAPVNVPSLISTTATYSFASSKAASCFWVSSVNSCCFSARQNDGTRDKAKSSAFFMIKYCTLSFRRKRGFLWSNWLCYRSPPKKGMEFLVHLNGV